MIAKENSSRRVDKNWDLKDRCLEVMETWCNLMVASLFVREFYVVIFFYRFYSSLIRLLPRHLYLGDAYLINYDFGR